MLLVNILSYHKTSCTRYFSQNCIKQLIFFKLCYIYHYYLHVFQKSMNYWATWNNATLRIMSNTWHFIWKVFFLNVQAYGRGNTFLLIGVPQNLWPGPKHTLSNSTVWQGQDAWASLSPRQSHELLSLFQASGVLAKNKPSGKKKR